MVVEGGHYVLPLRWHGIPVSLLCHKPPASAAPTAVPEKTKPHTPWYSQSYLVPAQPQMPPPQPQMPPPQPQMPPPNVPPPHGMYPQMLQPHVMYPQLYPQVPPTYVMYPQRYPQVPQPHTMYPQMSAPHVTHLQTPPPHLMHPHMLPEGRPILTQEDVPDMPLTRDDDIQEPLMFHLDMPPTQEDVPLVIPWVRSDQNESPPKTPQSYYLLPYADYPSGPEPAMAPIATTAERKPSLYPPFYYPYSHFPRPVPVTTSTPTVTAKPAATAPAVFPPPNYPHFPWSRVGSAQPTAKPTLPATRPQSKNHPFPPQNPFLHPYQYSAPKPETTTTKPHFAYMPLPYQSFPPRMVPPYPAPMTRRTNSPLQRSHPQPQYHVMRYPSS
ncbi:uncharacterized protein AB9W97_021094 [Spinachia spinachia]